MPNRLHRYYGAGYLHFITTSCYQRRALLGSRHDRDLFLQILERVRRRYHFVVVGFVVMPEHIHLLITEPEVGTPSTVLHELQASLRDAVLIWRDDPALEAPGYFQISLTGQNASVPSVTKEG
jgi:REP element-mobilizing transposase RayT